MEDNIQQPEQEKKEETAAQPEEQPQAQPEEQVKAQPEPEKAEAPIEEIEAPGEQEPQNIGGEMKWYVIQTYSGQEDKVKKALEQSIEINKLQSRIRQVLVPTEETVEIKGGKRTEKTRKMFPGYIFVEMALDEETWYKIRQTAGVARFIGSKSTPTPVSEREMQRVLKQLGKEEKLEITFEKGEAVRIISGAFRGYTGSIDEVNADKGKLKVLINIFGRDTPVEVNFEHAQKMV